jgi:CheY-like chemotaxis protein
MLHILVVEDKRNIRFMVSILLKQQGYAVTEAADGYSALGILNANPDFDLIISNVRMPGMDGIHLLTELKQFFPKIPLLLMSAYFEQPALQALQKNHAYLVKPYSRQELLDAVFNLTAV